MGRSESCCCRERARQVWTGTDVFVFLQTAGPDELPLLSSLNTLSSPKTLSSLETLSSLKTFFSLEVLFSLETRRWLSK